MNKFIRLINKIWKNSVVGNLISALIIATFSVIYNLILSKVSNKDFVSTLFDFWNFKFELWKIAGIFMIIMTIYQLIKRHRSKKKQIFKYDIDTLKLDRNLYSLITGELLTQQNVLDLRNQMFSSDSFPSEKIDWIHYILEENQKSDFGFFNPDLEILKNNMITEIANLEIVLNKNIFGAGQLGWLGVPKEWEGDRYFEATNQISIYERKICQKYDEFVKACRTTLKI